MLRIILIVLPLLAPLLLYIAYRWVRYGRVGRAAPKSLNPVTLAKLLALGVLLVLANILFLVRFDGVPAAATGYTYPQFDHAPSP